jgi:hypothetical protein
MYTSETKCEVKAVSMLSQALQTENVQGKFAVQLEFLPRYVLSIPSGCEVGQVLESVWMPRQREKVLLFSKIEPPPPPSFSPWQINIQTALLV